MELNIGKEKLNRLASRMKKGDSAAAAELYDELFPKTFGFCFSRTSRREVAEDLTQEIFLKLLDKIESFDEDKGGFTVWFWRLVRNHLIDHYREKRSPAFSDFEEEQIINIKSVAVADLDSKLEAEALLKFVATLGEEEKNIFELRYVAELPYRQMAEILGKSEGALRVGVARLKQKIKKQKNV